MRILFRTGVLALLSASVFGCVSDTPAGPDAGNQMGDEGGPCFGNGTCKAALVCVVPNICVKPDGGAEAGADAGTDTGVQDAASDGEAGATCLGKTLAW